MAKTSFFSSDSPSAVDPNDFQTLVKAVNDEFAVAQANNDASVVSAQTATNLANDAVALLSTSKDYVVSVASQVDAANSQAHAASTAAQASQGAAAGSATAAATSATQATANGAAQVALATTQAQISTTSATAAQTAQTAAQNARDTAIGQAQAALNSATAADTSAKAAATSATNADTSAKAAATSATNAANAQVNSDWNSVGGKSQILNKPALAAVATSGAKADVGLGNVDNTSDVNKPVSTAVQTALNAKAALAGNAAQNFASADHQMSSQNGGPLAGFRNRIINGAMQVAQRPSATGGGYQNIDRWFLNAAGANVTMAQYGGVNMLSPAVSVVMHITGAAGNIDSNVEQRIESINIRDLAGQWVTLSYWVYQDTGANKTINTGFAYPNSQDQFNSAFTGIANFPNVVIPSAQWTKVVCTLQLPAGAANGLRVSLCGSIGAFVAGQSYSIGWVQLEQGQVATPFEQRPFTVETALCERYYQKVEGGSGIIGNANTVQMYLSFRPMRVTPSLIVLYPIRITDSTGDGIQSSANATQGPGMSNSGGIINLGNFTGLTSMRPCGIYPGYLALSAEL